MRNAVNFPAMHLFGHLVLCAGWLLLTGCMADVRVQAADVNPGGWTAGEPAEAVWVNTDTVSHADIIVLVRHIHDVPIRDIPLRIETLSPDSLLTVDTILFRIPPPSTGLAAAKNNDFQETEQPYRHNVRLAKPGGYRFRITPAATEPLTGILAAGILVKPIR